MSEPLDFIMNVSPLIRNETIEESLWWKAKHVVKNVFKLGLIHHDCVCLSQLEEGGMVIFLGKNGKLHYKCMTKSIPSRELVIRVRSFVPSKGLV